jgi:hypothetical protein
MMLKSLMVQMNDSKMVTIMMCLSPGRVTCQKRRHVPAPSTDAASYISAGMDCSAARYDTPKNGKPRHQLATMTAAIAPAGVAMKATGWLSRPASSSTLLKNPRPGKASNIHRHVSAMMTVEVIHGKSSSPRKKLRHRHVPWSTSAITRPVSSFSATEPTVNTRLLRTTVRNVSSS